MSADLNSLQAPNDDKQFEQLCLHVLEHLHKTLRGQAYGRNGQAQHGVDFYIEVPASDGAGGSAITQFIGIQCKHKDRLLEGELGVKELEDEVKKAKGFKPALTTFIIATSAPTDTKPQDKARELTAEHQKQNPRLFSVEVWFWEKIRDEFSKNRELRHEVLDRFYPHLAPAQSAQHSVLHQLPTKPAHFTGRDEELAKLENEIASAHPAGATISGVRTKLHGAPGVGKTALATVLAHQLKEHYPDAQLYLNLRGAGADIHGKHSTAVKPVTPAEAMQSIIHAFHPEEKLPEEMDKLSVKYNGVLNEAGRVLLFLDNANDAAQVRPLLPPDNCLLLVTSRAQFSLPGLAVRNIDCLRPEMSQKLLRDVSPRITGCENEAAELCGHLPLALKVFGGVVNDKKLYAVPDLLKRLREGREKLEPVDAAFQISYDLLADDMRYRWVLLTVFPTSFNLPAAAAVWEAKEDSAREIMQALVNASLMEWNEANDRFRLHDLVRQFCDGKLTEVERTAAKLRYAQHYYGISKKASEFYVKGGKNLLSSLELFDRERTHIEMAFQFLKDAHTTGKDETERAKLLVALVGTIVNTGDLRFNSQKQIRWLEVQRDMARFTKERMQEANALGNLGIAYRRLDDPNKAITIYEECLKIHREINDREGEGKTLGNLGNAFFQIGEAAKAIKFLEEALTLKRETKDHHGMASSLGSLGNAYVRLGNVGMAIKLHIECFKLYRELGDPRGESYALGNLGNDYFALNKLREAIEFYIQALMINRLLQDENGEASTLWAYALALLRMGDRAQAIIHAEEALKIYESIESSTFSQVRAALMNWRGHA